jgi:putative oxidoreductase
MLDSRFAFDEWGQRSAGELQDFVWARFATNRQLIQGDPMNSLQRYVFVSARVLVALIFLANGFGIIPQDFPARELAEHGTPAALVPLVMLAGRTIEIAGAFGLMLGIYPHIAAIAVIAFLVPATLVAHDFWHAVGTPGFFLQLLQFLKNTAITGGLFFIAASPDQPTLFPRSSSNARAGKRTAAPARGILY